MTLALDGRVMLPVADPDDAERTAKALAPYLGSESTVVIVNVIEKGGGSIDKAPIGRRKEYAEEMFERARAPLSEVETTLETETFFGTDIVETIFEQAESDEIDAVVFMPRKSNRLAELLTGSVARRMVKEASVPVVTLPQSP